MNLQQQLESNKRATNELHAFIEFYKKHLDIAPVQANDAVLRKYIEPLDANAETLELALDNPEVRNRLAWTTPERSKAILQKQADEAAEDQAEQIRKNNQRLKGLSARELRAEIAATNTRYDIPIVSLNFTKKEILSMSIKELRRLMYFPDGSAKPGYHKAVDAILAQN